MKEQSHKSEMRAALRGDFERLRARRGAETALIEPSAPSQPVVGEPEPAPEAVPEPAPPAPADSDGGTWFDRLRGRA